MIKKWSWTPTYVKHNTETVFTSRTPPRRDHHGYTRGWCVLIRIWCQVIYNRTLTNSHLPITAGTAFERLYPAGVSELSPWQALAINEGIDLLPGRPDQTRSPGLQDILTMVKQDQQSLPLCRQIPIGAAHISFSGHTGWARCRVGIDPGCPGGAGHRSVWTNT